MSVRFRGIIGVFRSAIEGLALRDNFRSTIGIGRSFLCSNPGSRAEIGQSLVCGLRTWCHGEEVRAGGVVAV